MTHPIFEANISAIYDMFNITPVAFTNGSVKNKAGENTASAAIFAYAIEMELSKDKTLALFGEHYQNVLDNPKGTNHANIRSFMVNGFDGINFPDGRDGLSMRNERLAVTIENTWLNREDIKPGSNFDGRNSVLAIYEGIENGYLGPVAVDFNALGKAKTLKDGKAACHVFPWVKQGLLLGFKLFEKRDFGNGFCDTLPTINYSWDDFSKLPVSKEANRMVPPGYRRGSYNKGVSMMPNSWQNAGSKLGTGTMLDAGSTAGSCSRSGKNCHISGKAGLGGVFEPLGDNPTIIGDDVFIGIGSEPVEGFIVASGAVIAPSLVLTQSTKIFDIRNGKTEQLEYGFIPHDVLVVPGTYERSEGVFPQCAYIIKDMDPTNRGKVDINQMLRDL